MEIHILIFTHKLNCSVKILRNIAWPILDRESLKLNEEKAKSFRIIGGN
jgi:hypothetical protein